MIPKVYYLELHLAQVANELNYINKKVSSGLYDNKRVVEYICKLNDVVAAIKQIDFFKLSDNDKCQQRDILIFVSTCIQYLKSATIVDLIPALYICLRAALEDWVNDPTNYILTSYKADIGSHHYSSMTIKTQAIKAIQDNFGISIPYKLVSLGYPSHLEKDFISNVSLYHELGHFVDMCVWNISCNITSYIYKNKYLPMHDEYFSNIDETVIYDDRHCHWRLYINRLYNFISEYFADLFAIQYIGRHKIHLAQYMGGDNDFDDTHPSTSARTRAINNFLGPENLHDDLIKLFKDLIFKFTGKKLKIRSVPLSEEALLTGQPYDNISKGQLHSLFHNAWEIWEKNKSNFKDTPDLINAYVNLNSLLEQSIMNYETNR